MYQNFLLGGLSSLAVPTVPTKKNSESFNDGGEVAGMVIGILVVVVIVWILLIVSSYKLMGGGGYGVAHAIMTLLFGTLWVSLLWIYKGLKGAHFTK
jgi:small neutral amino acid transporter SnatA (MarC family)